MNWNCKKCIRCKDVYPSDDMTTDAFGDSGVQMCNQCIHDLEKDDSRYLLVEVPDIYGKTFVFKQELEELKRYIGDEDVKVINLRSKP